MAFTSRPPVTTTVTMPPPADASTVFWLGGLLRLQHPLLHELRLLHQRAEIGPSTIGKLRRGTASEEPSPRSARLAH